MTTTASRSRDSRAAAAQAKQTSRAPQLVVGLLVAVVGVAVVVALALGGSSTEAGTDRAAETSHIPATGTLAQTAPARIVGDSLPRLGESPDSDPAISLPAPSITASYFDGTDVSIDLADGQPRALLFFAHWCPHCQAEVEALVERFEREGVRDDVHVVAVSTGVDQGAPNYPPSQWLLEERWPLPVLRDSATGDLAAGFGLTGFPFMVLIDADGKVVARQSGAGPEGRWNSMLDRALAG